MTTNKTLSVRDEDGPLWERAARAAAQERMTLSALVATALARHLGPAGVCRVQMYERDTPLRWEEFSGRWLTDPPSTDPDYRSGSTGLDGAPEEWRAAVAESHRGRIVVYLHHWNYDFPPELHVFDDIDSARRWAREEPRMNRGLLDDASVELGRGGGQPGRRGLEIRQRDI